MEKRYRVTAENIDDIVTVVDVHGICIYVNQKAADLYGQEIKDMIGKSIFPAMEQDLQEELITTEGYKFLFYYTIYIKEEIEEEFGACL